MGYKGLVYAIPCNQAGFNAMPNIDDMPPTALIDPSRNINLHEGGIRKRGGTSHVNETALASTPQIMGLHDYQMTTGTQFLLVATTDGKIWKNYTTTIKTGWGTGKIVRFLTFSGLAYMFNGNNIPMTWNGADASTTNIANPAADWTGTSYPSWAVVHANGLARRIWCGGASSTPYTVYASAVGGGTDFTTTPLSFYIETGTGEGIVGAFEFGSRLFCMSKQNAFYINDTSSDTNYWGYERAGWNGGVAHHGLIAVTPNDAHMMMDDGEIYSFAAVQSSGDYRGASLTRPAYIHRWIQSNTDLSKIAQFHSVYDPVLRCVKWFMVGTGASQANICLPFFIDRPIDKAWGAPHNNPSYDSGYKASCSALVKVSTGVYAVYTGDYAGFVWKLEGTTKTDNGNGYYGDARWPRISCDDPRTMKHFNKMTFVSPISSTVALTAQATVDETLSTVDTVTLTAGASPTVVSGSIRIGNVGYRVQPIILTPAAGETDMFLSNIMIDFKPQGKKQ